MLETCTRFILTERPIVKRRQNSYQVCEQDISCIMAVFPRNTGKVILGGDLKFWPLKKGGPGVIAELWRGDLEILKRSMFKMETLTFCIWYYLKHTKNLA